MRILLADDEPDAAAIPAKGLREHAYAVAIGSDGRLALELDRGGDIRRGGIALILSMGSDIF